MMVAFCRSFCPSARLSHSRFSTCFFNARFARCCCRLFTECGARGKHDERERERAALVCVRQRCERRSLISASSSREAAEAACLRQTQRGRLHPRALPKPCPAGQRKNLRIEIHHCTHRVRVLHFCAPREVAGRARLSLCLARRRLGRVRVCKNVYACACLAAAL